tara:strand:- start:1505 stop:3700 length:2196 start_codon:yes stop_codon:yes gene_type:complete
MSITLRNTSDTATSQTYDYASKTTPLTSTEVDKNFITLKQKCDELATDYTTTFNVDGSLKDGAVTSVSITDNSVTATKIKDRSVDWAEQRNTIYVTDVSTTVNRVEGTVENYLDNTSLTELPANTIIYFKVANDNTGTTILTVKDKNTTTEKDTTLVSQEVLKQKDGSMAIGDLKAGGVYAVFYDGSTIQLVNSLQDPTIEVKESISRVQTFGPLLFPVANLETNGAATEKPHLLGVRPTAFTAMLECTDTETFGDPAITFAQSGDLIPLNSAIDGNKNPAFHVRVEEEFVYVSASSAAPSGTDPVVKAVQPSSGNVVTLTATKWQVVVRGTYQNDSTYSPAFVDRALTYPSSYPGSAISYGNYLYIWSAPTRNNGSTKNTLVKINLVTNRVIFVSAVSGHAQASMVRYASDNDFRATRATVHTAGTAYVVDDYITITNDAATSSNHSVFVIKEVGDNGEVESFYGLNDSDAPVTPASKAGSYSVTGDNPLDQGATPAELTVLNKDGGASSGTGLKIDVNYSNIAVTRLYWTAYDGNIKYIEPNGTDNPELVGTHADRTTSWAYQVAEVDEADIYGFRVAAKHTNMMKTIYFHELLSGKGVVSGGVKNAYDDTGHTPVQNFEGHTNKRLECCQWNPVKRRLYVSGRGTSLLHIFTVPGDSTLKTFFDSNSKLTYVKTIGIPGVGTGQQGGDSSYTNSTHVDWDTDTGEEKSITLSRYALQGTVTRASWKED